MLCDVCHKKAATIHVTEIINDEVQEIHICEECAKKKGMMMNQKFGLADFLADLADFGLPSLEDEGAVKAKLRCTNCGLTFEDFKKIGRLGCSNCYEVFKKGLIPLLKRIHGSSQHNGKLPQKVDEKVRVDWELNRLQQKLHKVIEKEEFEEAARIRDAIKKLKDKRQKEDKR